MQVVGRVAVEPKAVGVIGADHVGQLIAEPISVPAADVAEVRIARSVRLHAQPLRVSRTQLRAQPGNLHGADVEHALGARRVNRIDHAPQIIIGPLDPFGRIPGRTGTDGMPRVQAVDRHHVVAGLEELPHHAFAVARQVTDSQIGFDPLRHGPIRRFGDQRSRRQSGQIDGGTVGDGASRRNQCKDARQNEAAA